MSNAIARHVFTVHHELVRRILAKRITQRLAGRGIHLGRTASADLVDDGVARVWVEFNRRFAKHESPKLALLAAARIVAKRLAMRRLPCMGSERKRGQTDAMDHRSTKIVDDTMEHRVSEQAKKEAYYALVMSLPAHLRLTADCAAHGVTQEVSAQLQGVCERTIGNHYQALRTALTYHYVCSAVVEAISG